MQGKVLEIESETEERLAEIEADTEELLAEEQRIQDERVQGFERQFRQQD